MTIRNKYGQVKQAIADLQDGLVQQIVVPNDKRVSYRSAATQMHLHIHIIKVGKDRSIVTRV